MAHKTCVLIFYTTFVSTFLVRRRIQGDIIIHVHRSSCKVSFFRQILKKFEFSRKIFEKFQMSNFLRAQLFHADRSDKATSCFSQFCESA
jgi:hypothetical protein